MQSTVKNNTNSSQAQEKLIFPKDVQIGKVYMVPHVILPAEHPYSFPYQKTPIPVSTHLHEDKKIIGFPKMHYHIDWRFVSKKHHKIIKRNWFSNYHFESEFQTAIIIVCNSKEKMPIEYIQVKCIRNFAAAENFNIGRKELSDWVGELANKFCNSQLKEINGQLICPHKGAVIDKNCKDKDGNYVCPAHLLRFNPDTLQVVPNNNK